MLLLLLLLWDDEEFVGVVVVVVALDVEVVVADVEQIGSTLGPGDGVYRKPKKKERKRALRTFCCRERNRRKRKR